MELRAGRADDHAWRRAARAAAGTSGMATVVLLLGACAGLPASAPARGTGFAGFPACTDVPTVTADPAVYRDGPRSGDRTQVVEAVHGWASSRPGFEELWLDPERHGWVTVGFHGDEVDVVALQEQVARELPGGGVVVVEVPYAQAELEALMDRVVPALEAAGAGPTGGVAPDVTRGVLLLEGVPDSPEAADVLERFAGEPLCVDAAPLVPEGTQPTGGDGWRLLGHAEGAGEPYRTGVATTDEQLAALWQEAGLEGLAPEVDWQEEVVVWFGAVYGSSCPVRLDGVAVTGTTVHGQIVVPGTNAFSACTEDANPHSFVVAVERSVLPDGPFVLQLDADDPPSGAPAERTMVDVDLSAPGATAHARDLHAGAEADGAPMVSEGVEVMPDRAVRYLWRPRPECSDVVVGPVDGTLWRRADGEPEWGLPAEAEVMLLPLDGDRLVVSTADMEYVFVRASDDICSE